MAVIHPVRKPAGVFGEEERAFLRSYVGKNEGDERNLPCQAGCVLGLVPWAEQWPEVFFAGAIVCQVESQYHLWSEASLAEVFAGRNRRVIG